MRVLPYSDDEALDESGNSPLQASVQKLADMIAASTRQKENDSLVHHLLPGTSVVRESWPIMEQRYVWYDVLNREGKPIVVRQDNDGKDIRRSVGFITGDILHIDDIDVWVNPENTKMQMARYHDGSISYNIRYYGAERSDSGHVIVDTIADALERRMDGASSVEPGVVFPTVPGALGRTNGVKLILHVAAMQGEPGKGYQPIRDYPGCVRRVLVTVDRLNSLPPAEPKRGG
jgi:hypothetical protein